MIMPMVLVKDKNPYRVNYFTILGIGPNFDPRILNRIIESNRKKLVNRIKNGESVIVGGHKLAEPDVVEAANRLLNPAEFAEEILLVHSTPDIAENADAEMKQSAESILKEVQPDLSRDMLHLSNLRALIPPSLGIPPEELPWPDWTELGVPSVKDPSDSKNDVQFDL